jgi:hypothetical protein
MKSVLLLLGTKQLLVVKVKVSKADTYNLDEATGCCC